MEEKRNDSKSEARGLRDLVPPPEICEYLEDLFPDSALVWVIKPESDPEVWERAKAQALPNIWKTFPAPTAGELTDGGENHHVIMMGVVFDMMLNHLKETVKLYGKKGGPWNVPSSPGTWISETKKIIKIAEGVRNG